MLITPEELNKSGVPDDCWSPHTYYSVAVAFSKDNPIHADVFYSGYLDSKGQPSQYAGFMHAKEKNFHDCYFMAVLHRLEDRNTVELEVDNYVNCWKIIEGEKK